MRPTDDPITLFGDWLAAARACAAIREPTAMTLATATRDGKPSARIVLLKQHDPRGFVFYTNLSSRKSEELKANSQAALCFYWMPLDRQVRIEGAAGPVEAAEADAYFASRDRNKQAGAWASRQSAPLKDRPTLVTEVAEIEAKYEGKPIPRPPHWSGWRLTPTHIEFWQQGDFRLHQRDLYTRDAKGGWNHTLLYP
jgi:pyridoxamine 5'-phosphate oxidase